MSDRITLHGPSDVVAAIPGSGTASSSPLIDGIDRRSLHGISAPAGVPFALLGPFAGSRCPPHQYKVTAMSTYSIPVSGPDPRLAFLPALALKAAHRAGQFLTAVKVTVMRGSQLVRTASTAAVAIIGSEAGYQLVRHAIRAVVTTTAKVIKAGLDLLGRGLHFLGRLARKAIAVVSPHASEVVDDTVKTWIVEPLTKATTVGAEWIGSVAEAVWELSDTGLVKTHHHPLCSGRRAAPGGPQHHSGSCGRQARPGAAVAMEAVLTLTNPVRALILVAGAFVAALGFAAFRLLDRTDSSNPDEPAQAAELLVDPATPSLVPIRGRRHSPTTTSSGSPPECRWRSLPSGRCSCTASPRTYPRRSGSKWPTSPVTPRQPGSSGS